MVLSRLKQKIVLVILTACIFTMMTIHSYTEIPLKFVISFQTMQNHITSLTKRMSTLEKNMSNLMTRESSNTLKKVNPIVKNVTVIVIKKVLINVTSSTILHKKSATLNSFWSNQDGLRQEIDLLNMKFKDRKQGNHSTCLVTNKKCKTHLTVLILITTHATHFERRETIRNTWGKDPTNPPDPRWKTVFLIGRANRKKYTKKLINEIRMYDDIILGDVKEDFYQLTFKIQMGFEWSIKYCSFDYLLKGDDDVFVNMPQLFEFLGEQDQLKQGLYAGNVQYQARVQRKGRYAVSKSELRKAFYPRYCSGGGYVLSKDVVEAFLNAFSKVPVLRIDDAYVGLLALKAGIDVIHNENFRMFENETACIYNNRSILHHPVKSKKCMIKLFKENLLQPDEL